jgi:hypothetical protein
MPVQEFIRRDTQSIFYAYNIIGCQNQIEIGTAFCEAGDLFVTSEFEFTSDNWLKQRLLFGVIHWV